MSEIAPVLIAVAPNGARVTQAEHPAVPLTPAEMAWTAAACRDAGAGMLHLHIRDRDGRHWLDAEGYRAAERAVRAAVGDDLLIQFTTEAAGRYRSPEQIALVRALDPAFISVGLREIFDGETPDDEARAFYGECRDAEIAIQHILYDAADVARLAALCDDGVVDGDSVRALFVLGRYSQGASEPLDLLPFLQAAPAGWSWMCCAFGSRERDCLAAAGLMGGHVRVGFENNRLLPSGETAPDNAASVDVVASGLRALDRPLMGADEARMLMGVTR